MSELGEPAWHAQLQEARRLRELKDEGGFVRQALAAFKLRPHRAEPLYDLARFYRERGEHDASATYAEAGLALKRPSGDARFVEDFVYQTGLREEYSIAANYAHDPARKDRGFAACNWLALNRNVPAGSRELARSNLRYYLLPASAIMPSFMPRPVGFVPPDGHHPMNPSVARQGDRIVLAQRTVNYTLDHSLPELDMRRFVVPNGAPIRTRNFLLRLNGDLEIQSASEILPPQDLPEPVSRIAMGFEDPRLFAWRDGLWCCTSFRELNPQARFQQVLARVDEHAPGSSRLTDWRVLQPEDPDEHEKNWMPRVAGETLQFVRLCDPTRVVDERARTILEAAPAIVADQFRGGSQLVAFDGGWLALIHEVRVRDQRRFYRHRFVRFDKATRLRGVSRPFYFHKYGIEFAAGLAWHPDGKRLLISYGIDDAEAWIATVDAADVRRILDDVERLPWGAPGEAGQAALRQLTGADGTKSPVSTASAGASPNGQAGLDTHHHKIKGFSARPPSYDRIKYWLKGEPIQNFGDFLTELLLERLFVGDPVAARHIHLVGSVISDAYVAPKHDGAASDNALDVGKVVFWGCGLRDEQSLSRHLRANVDFLAVRGPLTRKALDLPNTVPIGDPGLLLPAIYQPRPARKFLNKSVCIPHFLDRRSDSELLSISGCDVLLRPNIENSISAILEFIDAIAAANFVLSSSLHGAITAAAYMRPFAFWDNGIIDCLFKWQDFAASANFQCRFLASFNQALEFFYDEIAPNLNFPALRPLLENAPLTVRQDALANVIAADVERHGSEAFHFEMGQDISKKMGIEQSMTLPRRDNKGQTKPQPSGIGGGTPSSGGVRTTAVEAKQPVPDQQRVPATTRTGAKMKKICLSMIVKNEAPVIRRCLDSVRPIIDYWVIVDTGSTDGTQDIIREHFKDLPGELHERPWRDFAYNRSEALTLARPHAQYSLIIDADDALEIPAGFQLLELTADSYMLDIQDSDIHYQRTQLVRNTLPWRYRGVLHEFLACEGAQPAGHLPIVMHRNHDGARRRDPKTYQNDAAILERALPGETDPFLIARYTFYLAQSYRDCGEKAKAIEAYLRRAELGYWDQEVFFSLYKAAQIKEELGHDHDEVIALYLRASDAAPNRAEALHGACRLCRNAGRSQQGYEIGKRGLALTPPTDGLFVEPWIYEHGLLDEFSVNAYWAGHYRECLDASLKILASGKLSGSAMQRVVANARFAAAKLPAEANLGSLGKESFTAQHALRAPRPLRTRLDRPPPRVLVAILAKQKEPALPLYLECIEALDYPKSSIVLQIRTNNNTDRTEQILREWVARVGHHYAAVEFDASDVAQRVEQFREHEWNATRFNVLGRIRNTSLSRTLAHGCDFYFVADVDNFIRPATLRELVALDLPIAAPLLRSIIPERFYSNCHAEVDAAGYYKDCDQYFWIVSRHVRGIVEVPVVHCTYLVRADVIPELTYQDATNRHEYVVFSDIARKAGIPQYLDNRQVYGYVTFGEGDQHLSDGIERARTLLRGAGDRPVSTAEESPPSPSTPGGDIAGASATHSVASFA